MAAIRIEITAQIPYMIQPVGTKKDPLFLCVPAKVENICGASIYQMGLFGELIGVQDVPPCSNASENFAVENVYRVLREVLNDLGAKNFFQSYGKVTIMKDNQATTFIFKTRAQLSAVIDEIQQMLPTHQSSGLITTAYQKFLEHGTGIAIGVALSAAAYTTYKRCKS